MGVVKVTDLKEYPGGRLGIWELNEPCDSLVDKFHFTKNEKRNFMSITHEKRKCEFLSVRLLLQEMVQSKIELFYDSLGKPLLEDNRNISISHSSDLVVILLADKPAGIDVENLNRTTEKIASRFLSETEMQHVINSPRPEFTRILYWCAKEALYKCTPLTGIEFNSQILIRPFIPAPDAGKFYGELLSKNNQTIFVFHYFILKKNAVVYCMEKKDFQDIWK